MGTMVEFQRPDGKAVQGYLAVPAHASNAPAIVVIQEWWGLNEWQPPQGVTAKRAAQSLGVRSPAGAAG